MQSFKKITLYTWEFNVCAITALKTININRHFLTFKSRRNTTNKNDFINTFQLCYYSIIVNSTFCANINLHISTPSFYKLILYFYIIIFSCLYFYRCACRSCAPCVMFLHLLPIYKHLKIATSLNINYNLTTFLRM